MVCGIITRLLRFIPFTKPKKKQLIYSWKRSHWIYILKGDIRHTTRQPRQGATQSNPKTTSIKRAQSIKIQHPVLWSVFTSRLNLLFFLFLFLANKKTFHVSSTNKKVLIITDIKNKDCAVYPKIWNKKYDAITLRAGHLSTQSHASIGWWKFGDIR